MEGFPPVWSKIFKYKANFNATDRGWAGQATAALLGDAKEEVDYLRSNDCVYMDEEFQQVFNDCAVKSVQCDEKKLDEFVYKACKQYQGTWHKKDKTCWFKFDKKYCQRPDVECPDISEQTK